MKTLMNGKVALVTGSTQGIGLEIACQLANAGCRLMLNGLDDPASVETAKEKLRAAGADEVAFSAADLSDPTQAIGLIADTANNFGHVDIRAIVYSIPGFSDHCCNLFQLFYRVSHLVFLCSQPKGFPII